MRLKSQKIQVVVDANVYSMLTQMADASIRGKSRSEVAYKILDEWLWANQEKLAANGIQTKLSSKKSQRPK
jgi:hypothetical protein